ncbi:MAG: hypothetical protein ABFE07_29220 [Armatimonadia bacterium]
MRPTSLAKDLILQFLQDLFSEPELYDDGNAYRWSADAKASKILICDGYTEDLERLEQRPAIVLRRGMLGWTLPLLTQRLSFDMRTGASESLNLIHSDLTAECLSRNGLEAELLADIVFQAFQFFALQIRQRGAFEVKSVLIGPETLIQSDSQQELSAVPVGLTLSFKSKWRLTPSQQLLEKIKVNLEKAQTLRELQRLEVSATPPPSNEGS